ncbi:membrane hypothetical protein [uncultured delta proteobacterium]|uniref:Uncharacterized protein n=1 Tax=uncultured delta proteobacterium TaxID=34034 RepID=A0A212J5R1_9DELT|nr:membrane hypothetical protein [uncultured delta proteobacterium]
MDYQILTAIADNSRLLFAIACVLFGTAALGNFRIIWSLLATAAFSVFAIAAISGSHIDFGMAGIIVIPAIIGGACLVFVGSMLFMHSRPRPPAHSSRIKIVCMIAGGVFLVLSMTTGSKPQLLSDRRVAAIQSVDIEKMVKWSQDAADIGEKEWKAIAALPLDAKTLAFLEGLVKKRPQWTAEVCAVLLEHRPSRARLEFIRGLTRQSDYFVWPFLVGLYEQQDKEAFWLAVQKTEFKRITHVLAEKGRFDVIEAMWDALDEPGELPEGVPRKSRQDFVARVSPYDFFPRTDLLAAFLAAGLSPDATFNTYGQSAFMRAIQAGNREAADALLKAGAKTEYRDSMGRTALLYAIQYNDSKTFHQLLSHKKILSIPDAAGLTPLHMAAWMGNPEMTEALLEAGVPADDAASSVIHLPSPLFFAATGGGPLMMQTILKKTGEKSGELIRQTDTNGKSVFDLAVNGVSPLDLCRMLDAKFIPGQLPSSFGLDAEYPILDNLLAFQEKRNRTASLLLAGGADPFWRSPDGGTVFHALFDWKAVWRAAKRKDFIHEYNEIPGPPEQYALGWWERTWHNSDSNAKRFSEQYREVLAIARALGLPDVPVANPSELCRYSNFPTSCWETFVPANEK